MFRELRNRLVSINFGITTIVIVAVFSFIYFFETHQAHNRPPIEAGEYMLVSEESEDVMRVINLTIEQEKEAAAHDLLITLVIAGVVIELIVVVISYVLAEEAIKPVREAYVTQKVFIANASHEIKTPLAAISANLEAADIHGNKWIDNVARETDKLAALNGELLTLARTDLMDKVSTEEVDLGAITRESLKSFEPRARKLKMSIDVSAGKTKINKADYLQILSILMDNAIKYADTEVRVRLRAGRLTVANDGAKIAEADLPHVFDRFYQADKNAEGVGLGLAIAKAAADRNHWQLSVKSDKHTVFTLNMQ